MTKHESIFSKTWPLALLYCALTAIYAYTAPLERGSVESANFASWLAEAVEEFIEEEYTAPGQKVVSVEVAVPGQYSPPEIFDSFRISIPSQRGKGARVFALVTFSNEGKAVSRVNVVAKVAISRKVAVAKTDIRRGAIVGAQDVEVETRTLGLSGVELVSEVSGAIGMQAERGIKAGTVIRIDYLSRPKLVRAGDIVTVIAESGGMKITMMGKAKQDGDRGQGIKITNVESKKTISARVKGPGKVVVEF